MFSWIRRHEKRLLKWGIVVAFVLALGTYYLYLLNQPQMMYRSEEMAVEAAPSGGGGLSAVVPRPMPAPEPVVIERFAWYDKFVLPVVVPMFLIWWTRWVEARYRRREVA